MPAEEMTFTYKPDTAKPAAPKQQDRRRHTFVMPFVILSFLVLPSLAVLAIGKPSAGFDVLVVLGYYQLIQALLWVLVPAAALFGVLYLIRTRGVLGRVLGGLLLAVLLGGFVYVMLPR